MRTVILFCCFLSLSTAIYSQDLIGEWQGSFSYDEPFNKPEFYKATSIALKISRDSINTYKIFSYTSFKTREGKDTTEVCRVSLKKIGKKSFILEEHSNGENELGYNSFQRMFLRYYDKKGRRQLKGTWTLVNEKLPERGSISFEKTP